MKSSRFSLAAVVLFLAEVAVVSAQREPTKIDRRPAWDYKFVRVSENTKQMESTLR